MKGMEIKEWEQGLNTTFYIKMKKKKKKQIIKNTMHLYYFNHTCDLIDLIQSTSVSYALHNINSNHKLRKRKKPTISTTNESFSIDFNITFIHYRNPRHFILPPLKAHKIHPLKYIHRN